MKAQEHVNRTAFKQLFSVKLQANEHTFSFEWINVSRTKEVLN